MNSWEEYHATLGNCECTRPKKRFFWHDNLCVCGNLIEWKVEA